MKSAASGRKHAFAPALTALRIRVDETSRLCVASGVDRIWQTAMMVLDDMVLKEGEGFGVDEGSLQRRCGLQSRDMEEMWVRCTET